MDNNKQSGFGVVLVIVAMLLLAGLGYVGYRLYEHFNKLAAIASQSANSSTSTTPSDPNCDGQVVGVPVLGNIDRSTDSSVPHGPTSFAKVGDYYYYYYSPEATCSDQDSVNAVQTATIQLFKESMVSLEAAK